MKLSTRYGLVGIAALALLAAVDWLRDLGPPRHAASAYLLGVVPNFAAAIAIAFVLLSIASDRPGRSDPASARRAFGVCAAISGVGLFAWEFAQTATTRLVFDPHDLCATLVGVGVAALLFAATTPRADRDV